MTFKKDYINYLLHTVVNTPGSEFRDSYRLSKLVDTIMSMDDVMKVTYLIGKTAGLEGLFKYLLYISDKIDKSQVTIFNLKDNFDYDLRNLTKICERIDIYKSENVQQAIENIDEEIESKDAISINTDDSSESIITAEETSEITDEGIEGDDTSDGKLTLIENKESYTGGAEVFELESITDSLENTDAIEGKGIAIDDIGKPDDTDDEEDVVTGEIENDEILSGDDVDSLEEEDTEQEATEEEKEESITAVEDNDDDKTEETEVFELNESDEYVETDNEKEEDVKEEFTSGEDEEEPEDTDEDNIAVESELDLEIEVRKPTGSAQEEGHVKEEAITNEAYYKFETKFFEEVKILEKLFAAVDKDCRTDETGKLSEKCLQCFTEIIEITSELASLARQLSFDLIADIFLTMNLYTTKAISQPEILTSERIKLLDSSLALVNSLIKGEDYLNYDTVVDKITDLKAEISGEKEEKFQSVETQNKVAEPEIIEEQVVIEKPEVKTGDESNLHEPFIEKPPVKQSQMDSAVFKLKYLVKEFEKSFISIENFKGEYSKFDALEKIAELNNALRLIAKISAIVKLHDVLKLAEVTYVFLKYVKDYRMDLMEPEIKQIVKYIIFTFKMLLTNRKPEDFNVLVQHLNNPVKIFADS